MKTIRIEDENVTTLKELAKDLASKYGWTSHEVRGDEIYFKAKDGGKSINGRIELYGFAYDVDSGDPIDDWNVDWDADFDAWSNHLWAETEDGETVMLHD